MTRKSILAAKRGELQKELEAWVADPKTGVGLARDEIVVVEIGIKRQSAPRVKVSAIQKWHEEIGTEIPKHVWKKLLAVPWGYGRRTMFQAFRDNNNQPMSVAAMAEITRTTSYFLSSDREATNRSLKAHGIPLRLKSLQHGFPHDTKLYQLVLVRDLSPRPPAQKPS